MATNLTSTERVLKLAPEGLSALAGLMDNSIQEAMGWLYKEREDFIDASEVQTRIRSTILQTETHINRRAALAAGRPTRLEELGVRLEGGPSCSIIARIVGVPGHIRIMHRPRTVVPTQMVGPEGLFEPEFGPLYLFYTERGGCLDTLTLVESYTSRDDFFLKGCQAVDLHEVPRTVMSAPTSTVKTDELSDLFRQVPEKLAREKDEATTWAAEAASLPREGTTDN